MAHYLMKYKGAYRVLPEFDVVTNDIPRDINGEIAEGYEDIYIACQYGNKIFCYGHDINGRMLLTAYIPSVGRGHNIIKKIFTEYQNGNLEQYSFKTGQTKEGENVSGIDYERLYRDTSLNNIIFNIIETDAEVEFRFRAKDIELIAPLLKPKISGANISPFSPRNLPQNKDLVQIPTEEIQRYKEISSRVLKEDLLLIHKVTTQFLSTILTQKSKRIDKSFNYKTEIKQLKLSRLVKEYIYYKEMWEDYLKYLDKEITQFYESKE